MKIYENREKTEKFDMNLCVKLRIVQHSLESVEKMGLESFEDRLQATTTAYIEFVALALEISQEVELNGCETQFYNQVKNLKNELEQLVSGHYQDIMFDRKLFDSIENFAYIIDEIKDYWGYDNELQLMKL